MSELSHFHPVLAAFISTSQASGLGARKDAVRPLSPEELAAQEQRRVDESNRLLALKESEYLRWAARLAAARAARPELTATQYLRHTLFDIREDTGESDYAELAAEACALSLRCFREEVLEAGRIEGLCGLYDAPPLLLLMGPQNVGRILHAYHTFSFRHKRYRAPTFDLGLGEEENPDSYESWAGFARAVLEIADEAEAESSSD